MPSKIIKTNATKLRALKYTPGLEDLVFKSVLRISLVIFNQIEVMRITQISCPNQGSKNFQYNERKSYANENAKKTHLDLSIDKAKGTAGYSWSQLVLFGHRKDSIFIVLNVPANNIYSIIEYIPNLLFSNPWSGISPISTKNLLQSTQPGLRLYAHSPFQRAGTAPGHSRSGHHLIQG